MRISDWSSDVCSSDLAYAPQVAELVGSGRVVLEFGSGSSIKTPLLLRELAASVYVPLDISGEFLRQASIELAAKFPELPIIPIEANFMRPVRLPRSLPDRARLGFFPGSTIGNMVRSDERRVGKGCVRKCRSWGSTYN